MVHRSYKRRTPNKASTLVLHKKSRVKDEAFGKSIFFSKDGRKIHRIFFLVGNWLDCHCAFQDTSRSTPSENHQTRPYHLHQPASRPCCLHPPTQRPCSLPIKSPQISTYLHPSTPLSNYLQSTTPRPSCLHPRS